MRIFRTSFIDTLLRNLYNDGLDYKVLVMIKASTREMQLSFPSQVFYLCIMRKIEIDAQGKITYHNIDCVELKNDYHLLNSYLFLFYIISILLRNTF